MKIKNYVLTFLLFTSSFVYSQTGTIIVDSIMSGGVYRLFRLYIPTTYNSANPVPLVLNLHGLTSNATEQEQYGDFRKIADTENFIIVHPQGLPIFGTSLGWTTFSPMSTPNEDLQFLSNLLDTISLIYTINQNKIYSTGMSNGGFMSYDLACFLSNRIAAMASVTGSMTPIHLSACNTQHPMPVMQIHGTNDNTLSYIGAPGGPTTPIDTLVRYWVNFNHCDTTPVFYAVPDTSASDNCTAEHYVYAGGDAGSTVEFYKIIGGGHSWPGAPVNLNTTNMDFSASKEIWRFFSQYTLITEIDEQKAKVNTILIYPNPSNGIFTVELKNNLNASIKILNMLGETICEKKITNLLTTINMNDVPGGIYFYQIKEDFDIIESGKLIIK